MTGGIYPGPGPDRQYTPITRGQALAILAILAICGAILALAILGAVI
jgi:hypothetical protein